MPVIFLINPRGFAKKAKPAKAPPKPAIPCSFSIAELPSPNVFSQFSPTQLASLVNILTKPSQIFCIRSNVLAIFSLFLGSLNQSKALYITRLLKNFIRFPKNPIPPPTIFATVLLSSLPPLSASNLFSLLASDARPCALFARSAAFFC